MRSARRLVLGFGLAMFLAPVCCAPLSWAESPDDAIKAANLLSTAFEKVAEQITPSVVNIVSTKKPKMVAYRGKNLRFNDPFFEHFRQFFGDDFMGPNDMPNGGVQQGLGTGVVVDSEGDILTNNHVVNDADEVMVRLPNDEKVKAKVVGTDPRSDLAVIRIKAAHLTPAKLGDSDSLRIGEWVVAAGNPFGLDNSITAGIVSAKGRSISGGNQYEDFIQTDAAINPGNSGGPLVNLRGEVVGINTAIFSKSGGYMGIGFAIPINMAKNVMQSLISKGKVVRGWLGIGIQELTDDLAQSFNFHGTDGALVGHVEKDGPAARAGIKQGDIITKIGDEKIKNINQLRNLVATIEPGHKVDIDLVRNGSTKSVTVKIGELPAQVDGQSVDAEQDDQTSNDIGVSVDNLTPDLARRLGSDADSGVVVRSVEPGSIAAQSGLMARDLIISINGQEVKNVSDFNRLLEKADLKKGARLVVESSGMDRFIILHDSGE